MRPTRLHLPCLIILALILLAACGSSTLSLVVTVSDATDGAPLSGARVSVEHALAVATSTGHYELTLGVPSDDDVAVVLISAPGYVSQSISLPLAKNTTELLHEVALEPRRLDGHVYDAITNDPVAETTLGYGAASVRTDDDGAFSLPATAFASLSATAPGYVDREVPVGEVRALFAEDGTLLAPLSVVLEPRTLSGRITESGSDAPLAGVQISVGRRTTETDADGHYELRYVEPGESLVVTSPAHRPVDPVIYDGVSQQLLGLTPWQIAVVVTDAANGEPLANASVSAGALGAVTDAEGTAVLRLAPPAEVEVTLDGYAPQTLAFTGQERWEIALSPSRLSVLVRDQVGGTPLEDARVQLVDNQGAVTWAQSDDQGRLSLDDYASLSALRVKMPGYWVASTAITSSGSLTLDVTPLQARGIYVPFALLAVPDYMESLLDLVETSDLNAMVIDVKSDKGYLAWESAVPLAVEIGAYQPTTSGVKLMDIRALVDECHRRGIYTIARQVVFKDDVLAQTRPEYAVTKQSGGLYTDYASQYWVDPFRQEVRDYNTALVLEVAALGFDEIQFDYVRFPTEGPLSLVRVYSQEDTTEGRVAAITAYLRQAYEALAATPAFLSADIFGLNVWVKVPADNNVGQRLEDLAPYVDFVSPMLYPATFWPGNLGFANPSEYPYLIPYLGTTKSQERAPHVAVRPWLQYYSWGEPAYDVPDYLLARRGAEDAAGSGWLFWNAKAKYQAEVFDPALYAQYEEDLLKAIAAEKAAAAAE